MAMSTSVLAAAQDSPADQALAKIHTRLISAHPQLSHISAAEMTAALAGQDDILLLDVRKEKEYAVSHIDGALRVDPGISADEFMQIYGEQLAGKNVILYCSVGRRSSHLGDKLRPRLMERGAAQVSNLEGGIFGWHNHNMPLMRGEEATDKLHPYNPWWGRLVTRKDAIAYKPDL